MRAPFAVQVLTMSRINLGEEYHAGMLLVQLSRRSARLKNPVRPVPYSVPVKYGKILPGEPGRTTTLVHGCWCRESDASIRKTDPSTRSMLRRRG